MNYDNRFNTKIKVYPDGNFKATYCNKCIFPNLEIEDKEPSKKDIIIGTTEDWDISFKDWQIYMPYHWENTLKNDINLEKPIKYEHNDKMFVVTAKDLQEMGINTFTDFINRNKSKKKSINLERSLKRAKEKIFDIVYINDFKYFVTVNFNPDLVNSRNAKEVMKKMRSWLCNNKNRLGIEYILVPEYHPESYDGVKDRIHCHLLITDYPQDLLVHAPMHKKGGELVYNKDGSVRLMYTSKGQPIYNMLGWKYGFSTCIPVYKKSNESNIRLAQYITKYITKDVHKIFGKFYWSSKGLERDVPISVCNTDYNSLDLKEYEIPNTTLKLKYESQFDYVIGGNKNEKEK